MRWKRLKHSKILLQTDYELYQIWIPNYKKPELRDLNTLPQEALLNLLKLKNLIIE